MIKNIYQKVIKGPSQLYNMKPSLSMCLVSSKTILGGNIRTLHTENVSLCKRKIVCTSREIGFNNCSRHYWSDDQRQHDEFHSFNNTGWQCSPWLLLHPYLIHVHSCDTIRKNTNTSLTATSILNNSLRSSSWLIPFHQHHSTYRTNKGRSKNSFRLHKSFAPTMQTALYLRQDLECDQQLQWESHHPRCRFSSISPRPSFQSTLTV